ncbi:MAG: fluoride efflux transporter CrcB [Alphaproteobacteria bacterium]|nr:fluoride efflux transporter CrcB [Alphaproteobacteria bacterium]
MNFLYVFIGGGIGAVARYGVTLATGRVTGSSFPWHTLSVNLIGALLIGGLTEFLALRVSPVEPARLFLVTGILGGFTTFSAFSLESAMMWEKGDYATLAVYVAVSVVGTLAAALGGGAAMRAVL